MKNVDPRPRALIAHARPPIRSLALRTIASPTVRDTLMEPSQKRCRTILD